MAYNGWKNYETWCVALWIDNEQGSYLHRCGLAAGAWDDAEKKGSLTRLDQATTKLADCLKEWIDEMNPLASDASLFSDLLGAALGEVDWYEIAENFLADVDTSEEDKKPEVSQ